MNRQAAGFWMPRIMFLTGIGILYIPILTLVIYSFVDFETGAAPSLAAYSHLVRNGDLVRAVVTSMLIGATSATLSTVLGGAAAFAFERGRPWAKGLFDSLSLVPMVLPEIVFGLGLLTWFVFLRVSLGTVSLILAHVTFSVSYVALTVRGRVRALEQSIDDAARDLGATPWQLFSKVQLPLIAPALVAGWMMAFTLSFDDFLISFFTSGPDTVTLPMALYSVIRFGVSPEVFAMATVIFGVSFISAVVVTRLTGGRGIAH
jgi:ABC-type spermidine/putrescine transport system permease subunit II